ncbi:hypothetical protein [Sphaerisporangium corydalis]|nr:hypothetical protein [Sphaerisporangium corydalis]
MPTPWSRGVQFFQASRAGRRDGRHGVPYDHFPYATSSSGVPGGSGDDRWTKYIRAVAADSACRRARVMKSFIRDTKEEEGALLVAAGTINELSRRLEGTGPPAAPAPGPSSQYPLPLGEVIAARRARLDADARGAADRELAAARKALAEKLALYQSSVRQMRTDMNEVASFANHVVSHYHQALDRSYLARKRKEGRRDVRLPAWEPARIEPDASEERIVMSGDILDLLPPKIREVVEEALRNLGNGPASEGGAA